MLLCLDLSGSIVGRPLETMRKSVNKLLDVLRPSDMLGILVISDSAEVIAEPGSDKGALRTLGTLRGTGNRTALYYGMDLGCGSFSRVAPPG